jgi:hypothetical protein
MCDLAASYFPDGVLAAQHTWTRGCDGLHPSGPCPAPKPQPQVIYPGTAGIIHLLPAG